MKKIKKKITKKKKLVFFVLRVSLLALLSIMLLVGYIFLLASSDSIENEDIESKDVLIEETKLTRGRGRRASYHFYFYSENIEYEMFSIVNLFSEDYSARELNEVIKVGDIVSIDYIKDNENRKVVALYKGDEQLTSIDEANDTLLIARISGTFLFVFLEALVLAFIYFNILFGIDDLKRYWNKKERKKKREEKLNNQNKSKQT